MVMMMMGPLCVHDDDGNVNGNGSVRGNANGNINGISDVITGNTQTYYTQDNANSYQWSIDPPEMGTIEGSANGSDIQITWNLEGQAELFLTQTDDNGCETTESISINIT